MTLSATAHSWLRHLMCGKAVPFRKPWNQSWAPPVISLRRSLNEVQFVELYNTAYKAVDLSGWKLARGVVRPIIDSVYSIDEVRAAHERLESNESFGKVVLTISG